jgi:hypothetical protein
MPPAYPSRLPARATAFIPSTSGGGDRRKAKKSLAKPPTRPAGLGTVLSIGFRHGLRRLPALSLPYIRNEVIDRPILTETPIDRGVT